MVDGCCWKIIDPIEDQPKDYFKTASLFILVTVSLEGNLLINVKQFQSRPLT